MSSAHEIQKQFAVDVVRKLHDAGFRALWAGGCVRDLVLEHEPKDFDVATTATPDEVRNLFGRKQTIPVGASFGVIIVLGSEDAGQIEVATFRREGEYLDGRRPESVEYCTPEEDAHRRDFTINGMFYDPLTDTTLDYVGGRDDLDAKILRAIGNPEDRFAEDKLRMLRAVRFTARFGFHLDEATAAAIRKHKAEIIVVSAERITQELLRMLEHDRRRQAVELAIELGLWSIILPEFQSLESSSSETTLTLDVLQQLECPSAELALAVLCRHLPRKKIAAFAKRMKLSNQQNDQLAWLVEEQNSLSHPEQLPLHRLKRLLSQPHANELLEWTRTKELVCDESIAAYEFCAAYLKRTPPVRLDPEPLLTGDDLIRSGMRPGREFKTLLDRVRIAQLDEQIETREQAQELVAELRADSAPDKT